jgi:hypothetical protein
MHQAIRSLLFAVAMLGGLVSSASAQVATTQRVDQVECYSYEQYYNGQTFIYKACIRTAGLIHTTQTPSANTAYVFDGTVTNTLYVDGVFQEQAKQVYDAKYRTVSREGAQQVVSQNATYTFTFDGRPCNSTIHLQFANGQIQFNRNTFACA